MFEQSSYVFESTLISNARQENEFIFVFDMTGTSGKDETFHLNADSIKLISADIPRTFSRNEIGILFETRTGPLYRDLRQILLAFALFRQDIGYVQGMTFLAAFLLIHLSCDTFSAFRCFSNLMLKQHLYTFYSVRSFKSVNLKT